MNGLRRCGTYMQCNTIAIKKDKIMPFAATWMELETLILSEVSQKKKNTFPQKRKSWTWRIDLWLPRGEGVGWIGSLGLIDADYCLWNGLAMRSCCVAQGTMSSHLFIKFNNSEKIGHSKTVMR